MRDYNLTEERTAGGKSYGIAVSEDGRLIWRVGDITPSRRDAEALLELFRKADPEPIHFDWLLEDYLTDFTV